MSRLASPEKDFLRLLLLQQRTQAGVILAAGRATLQMSAHTGYPLIGLCSGKLQLHVPVELVEALLAAELGAGGTEQTLNQLIPRVF